MHPHIHCSVARVLFILYIVHTCTCIEILSYPIGSKTSCPTPRLYIKAGRDTQAQLTTILFMLMAYFLTCQITTVKIHLC